MGPRIIILFAGRFPSEKAASLFLDLNARALIKAGAWVRVVAPRRLNRGSLGDVPYEISYVPTVDLSTVPIIWNFANYISVTFFSLYVALWLLINSKRDDVIISNDALPLYVASFIRSRTMYEMHDFTGSSALYTVLLRRVRWVLATNQWKYDELKNTFGIPENTLLFERNAVDCDLFGSVSKYDARARLHIENSARLVVYTGHLYEWKGAATLAAAAMLMPDVQFCFVGGASHDVAKFKATWGTRANIHIEGHLDHSMIPIWQSAADVLALPNSGTEEISVHYTSPMKLFEYMASQRPVVASDLPSIREVLGEDGYYATPDDAVSFVALIREALNDDGARPLRARRAVERYSWAARSERILHRII